MSNDPVFSVQPEFANNFWWSVGDGRSINQALGDVQTRMDQAGRGGTAARQEFEQKVLDADPATLKKTAEAQIAAIEAQKAKYDPGSQEMAGLEFGERLWKNVEGGQTIRQAFGNSYLYPSSWSIDIQNQQFGKFTVGQVDHTASAPEHTGPQQAGNQSKPAQMAEQFVNDDERAASLNAGIWNPAAKHALDAVIRNEIATSAKNGQPWQGVNGPITQVTGLEDLARQQMGVELKDMRGGEGKVGANEWLQGITKVLADKTGSDQGQVLDALYHIPNQPGSPGGAGGQQQTVTAQALTPDEIKKIQKAAGMDEAHQTGKWDEATNKAVEQVILKAQLTDTYAHSGSHVEGIPGRNTMKGLDELVKNGKIKAEDAKVFEDIGAARLRTSYHASTGDALEAAVHDAKTQKFDLASAKPVIPKVQPVIAEPPPSLDQTILTGMGGPPQDLGNILASLPQAPLPLPPKLQGKGYRQGLMTAMPTDDGKKTQTQEWNANGDHNKVVKHGAVTETLTENAEGSRVTHSEHGKMMWSVVTDAKGNVVSDMERNSKGQLVETNPEALALAQKQTAQKRLKNNSPSNS